jgi:AAA domain/Primase C terminal 2 (PriCT-2)
MARWGFVQLQHGSLPLLTEDLARRIRDIVTVRLRASDLIEKGAKPNGKAHHDAVDIAELRDALKFIDDLALTWKWVSTLGWAMPGRALWAEWSRGCANKYSDHDQDKVWRSFDGSGSASEQCFIMPRKEGGGSKQPHGHEPDTRAGRPRAPTTFPAKDLNSMQFDSIKYVLPGFIAEGLTLFAGKPKIGKSWLLMHVAHAVAEGGYTLGGIACAGGDVLYAALEDNKRRLPRRMNKLFGTDAWPGNLHFTCEMPRLADGGIDHIKKWIEGAQRPRLVIIDTLAMVRMPNRKDQNSYDADYTAVKDLRDLAAEHGIAIILVHHLRKADADDPFDNHQRPTRPYRRAGQYYDYLARSRRGSDPG